MDEYQKFINELKLPPTGSDAPSVYAFSLHKSGSTLLFNMLTELAPYTGLTYFSLQDELFKGGVRVNVNTKHTGIDRFFKGSGYIYGGFRYYPLNSDMPDIDRYKKILLVRNPLDAMVSFYYSRVSSHKIPKKGSLKRFWAEKREETKSLSIDDFVCGKESDLHLNRILMYKKLLEQNNCYVFRYEDIIYDKAMFLKKIVNTFGWEVEPKVLTKIANKHDTFPDKESVSNHVRQVHPGNHKKHLSPESIAYLEDKFSIVLEAFGYTPSPRVASYVLESEDVGK